MLWKYFTFQESEEYLWKKLTFSQKMLFISTKLCCIRILRNYYSVIKRFQERKGGIVIFGVLVTSHGEFAKAAMESVQMIAGKQENVRTVVLREDNSFEQIENEMQLAYDELKVNCGEVVALCDIYGGTPFNVLSKLKLQGCDFVGFTGFNLPVLIDLCLSRDCSMDEVKARVKETYDMSLIEINPTVVEDDLEISL